MQLGQKCLKRLIGESSSEKKLRSTGLRKMPSAHSGAKASMMPPAYKSKCFMSSVCLLIDVCHQLHTTVWTTVPSSADFSHPIPRRHSTHLASLLSYQLTQVSNKTDTLKSTFNALTWAMSHLLSQLFGLNQEKAINITLSTKGLFNV